MLHIAARPGALTSVLEEAPEISLVGRKNILWIPCLGFCFVSKGNSGGQGGRGSLVMLQRRKAVAPGIANNYPCTKQRATRNCYLQQNLYLLVVTDDQPGEWAVGSRQQHVRLLYYKCSCLLQINPNCQLTSVCSTRCLQVSPQHRPAWASWSPSSEGLTVSGVFLILKASWKNYNPWRPAGQIFPTAAELEVALGRVQLQRHFWKSWHFGFAFCLLTGRL